MVSNFLLFFSLLATRFLGLNWGQGNFFHPDENNMAWGVGRLSWPNLNPEFFAYGQFPLYLVYFSVNLFGRVFGGVSTWQEVPFPLAVYSLRFFSAFFGVLSVIFGWWLAKELFKDQKRPRIYVLLLSFTPGLIQAAHFGTTESLLVFTALSTAYFSLLLLRKPSFKIIFFTVLVSAVGLAAKISAAAFLLAPVLAILFGRKKNFGFFKKVSGLFFYGILTLFIAVILSPQLVLNFEKSLSTLSYESKVAWGSSPVFYTRQFINTKPFIFQVFKIFPWVLGTPLFLLLAVALGFFVIRFFKKRFFLRPQIYLLLAAFLPWFLLNIFLFTKWTRFMTPILPFLVLLPAWLIGDFWRFLQKSDFKPFLPVVLIVLTLPGLFLLTIYLRTDIRISATEWIFGNIPEGSLVLSETGNVVDLPVWPKDFVHPEGNHFKIVNFDFYTFEEKEGAVAELDDLVGRADYVLVPSRRIFANYSRLAGDFPETAAFHQKLFSGELGFSPLIFFEPFGALGQVLLGSDLLAEETWTVFDHPTIRLFIRR